MTLAGVLLVVLLLTGVAGLAIGVIAGRTVRWQRVRSSIAVPAAIIGFAVACFTLFGAAFLHHGGRGDRPDGGHPWNCGAWWTEIGSARGQPDDLRSGSFCHLRAVSATLPMAAAALGAGVVTAGAVAGVLVTRRRRFEIGLRRLAGG